MGRTLRILCLAALAATMAACGGSSSSSSSDTLQGSDVAVVGTTHITKNDLDHQIKLELRAMTVKKQTIPKVGTSSYTANVVQPMLAFLVTDAQVHNIADQLSVTVSSKDIQTAIDKAITQYYSGDRSKYEADLEKYQLTDADIQKQFELTLLEQKIEAKLKEQVKVTTKDAQAYYDAHKSQYQASADTRQVDYVLMPSKTLAQKAHDQIAAGKSFKDVAAGSIDDSGSHEPFVFTKGSGDAAFTQAAFSLATNQLSGLVTVDKAYTKSNLAGKCKPTCYFVIRPTKDTVKKGTKQSFASVKSQIVSQLLSSKQQSHLQSVIGKLEKDQKKITKYAAGYAPATSTGSSSST